MIRSSGPGRGNVFVFTAKNQLVTNLDVWYLNDAENLKL